MELDPPAGRVQGRGRDRGGRGRGRGCGPRGWAPQSQSTATTLPNFPDIHRQNQQQHRSGRGSRGRSRSSRGRGRRRQSCSTDGSRTANPAYFSDLEDPTALQTHYRHTFRSAKQNSSNGGFRSTGFDSVDSDKQKVHPRSDGLRGSIASQRSRRSDFPAAGNCSRSNYRSPTAELISESASQAGRRSPIQSSGETTTPPQFNWTTTVQREETRHPRLFRDVRSTVRLEVDDFLVSVLNELNQEHEPYLQEEELWDIAQQAQQYIDPQRELRPLDLLNELLETQVLSCLIFTRKRGKQASFSATTDGSFADGDEEGDIELPDADEPSARVDQYSTGYQLAESASQIGRRLHGATHQHPIDDLTFDTSDESSFDISDEETEAHLSGRIEAALDEFLELNPVSIVFLEIIGPLANLPNTMGSTMIENFLREVSQILISHDEARLQQYLPIEPPFSQAYNSIIEQMRTQYANGSDTALEKKVDNLLSGAQLSNGERWGAVVGFMVQYLCFIRDVDPSNLLSTYDQLTELIKKGNSALLASEVGVIVLSTQVSYAKVLARLALGLEKQPELIAHLVEQTTDEGGERLSLPERAANTIRQAFVACLNENAQYSMHQQTRPIGRHTGIYKLANICLKIFFQCKKTKNAEQIFTNVGAKSPPIDIYPRSERVTYLYYLGRFYFSMSHFYRAQAVLQSAYQNCPTHPSAQGQRRLILIYLVTSNLILGRFPSYAIYQRPEALGFKERFEPICNAIRRGDIPSFRRLTATDNEHAPWFLYHRILLQIRGSCEVLLWRSLCRRVWNLNGNRGDQETRRPPFMELEDLVTVSSFLEKRALNPMSLADGGPGKRHTNWVFMSQDPPKEARYIDPEFEGMEDDDFYDEGYEEDPFLLPDMQQVESMIASLISQGLISGYVSPQKKLVIQGALKRPALEAGWPNVWQTISARQERNGGEIPGWKMANTGSSTGAGTVINLSGARPVGM